MAISYDNQRIVKYIITQDLDDYNNLLILYNVAKASREEDLEYCLKIAEKVKRCAARNVSKDIKFYEMYIQCLLFRAPYKLDDYILYVEHKREPEKQFYLPRRRVLKTLVDDLQDLADGKLYFLSISLPPRIGKSTLCIFFMTWIMGKYPDVANVMSGHSDKLTKGFYQELLSIIGDPETYCWNDVFPDCKLVANNQQDETIDINRKKRFPTITCRSMLGTLTGAVEIGKNGILYLDDAIEDLEESLNVDRLDKKYDAYLNQLRDRMKDGAKELQVATRWNVLDIIGRVQSQYGDDPNYRFRVIPALNENDESNFDYDYGVGFSTEYYHKMRNDIDDATWWAKYMGKPYVREGLLFPKDELDYYNGILPVGEADRIVSVCDVAFGGGDSLSSPIAYIYGEDVYIHDIVFNKGNKEITEPLLVGKYISNKVHQAQFEANNGGEFYAEDIDRILRENNYRMNITSKRADNKTKKMARIIQFAPDIKKFHFRNDKARGKEYDKFMEELTMIVVDQKGNKHDDSADSLRMLAEFVSGGLYARVTSMKRPF